MKLHDDTQSPLSTLKIALRFYRSDFDKCKSDVDSSAAMTLVKSRIKDYISNCLDEGMEATSIKKQLNELSCDALIPQDVSDWCYDKLDELSDQMKVTKASPPAVKKERDDVNEAPPLYSKESVYHASLCAYVVSSTQRSSKLSDLIPSEGHTFKEMSLSKHSDRQRMFIAMKDDGVVYIAFEGETKIEEWLRYSSIQEGLFSVALFILMIHKGLKTQTESIPLRYFFELLHQGKRLIFTGNTYM